jgi:hypothetical protein
MAGAFAAGGVDVLADAGRTGENRVLDGVEGPNECKVKTE